MERYQNNIQDQFGNAISGVTVTVRKVSDGSIATLFSDDGVTGKSNPFTNDSDGEFFFYAANDRYDIFFTGAITDQKDDVILFDGGGIVGNWDIQTDTDAPAGPTGQVGSGSLDYYDLGASDQLADVGFDGAVGGDFTIRNQVHAGEVYLRGAQTAGTDVVLIRADPDGQIELHHSGVRRVRTGGTGVSYHLSDGNTDTENRYLAFVHQDLTIRGLIGHNTGIAGDTLEVANRIPSGPVYIRGRNTGDTTNNNILVGDPDAALDLYYAGTLSAKVSGLGVFEIRGDQSNDTDVRILRYHHANGTERGAIGYGGDDVLAFRNAVHGGNVELSAEDTGGIPKDILVGDPDGITTIRGDTNMELRVANGELGIQIVANAQAQLYWNNQANFRTSDESAADIHMGAEIRHNDDAFYPVGMNVAPEENALDTGNETLDVDNVGKMLTYNTATARSLLFNNIANTKVGSMWALKVGPSAGTLTGDGGTGVQIRWWNGTGWTTTAAAGNITIGVGSYTIWKETDTLYWIDGPTLS